MQKIYAHITSVAAFIPENILTNFDLEKMVDTNDEWIRTRTGIYERRILDKDKGTSDMCAPVVIDLCKQRNISPEDIDVIIVATTTPDMFFPNTSNLTALKSGAKNAWTFDLMAACSGFLFALNTAATLIESGRYQKVVVIGGDKMSSIVDYTDRNTCILFGDAAAGILLEASTQYGGIIDSILKVDGIGAEYLYMKGGGSVHPATQETVKNKEHFIYQEGQKVFKYAVKEMSRVTVDLMKRHKLKSDDIKFLIPHQANLRIIDATAEAAGLPKEKVAINIEKYGNTTAATIPLCLWEWHNRIEKNDNILFASFGGGFTFGSMWVKWTI